MNLAFKQTLVLLLTYFRPQRWRVLFLAALVVGSVALQLINPQIVKAIIDTAQSGTTTARIAVAALLFVLFGLGQAALSVTAAYIGEQVSWIATNALRRDLALHILRLDMEFHNSHTPGELIERVDGDVRQLANFFSQLVLRVVASVLLILGVITILWLDDWRLGVAGAIFAFVVLFILRVFQGHTVHLWNGSRESIAGVYGFIEERLNGREDTLSNGGTAYVMRRLAQLQGLAYRTAYRAFFFSAINFGVTHLLFVVATALGLAYGIWLFQRGEATIGTVYIILYYMGILRAPLEQIREQISELQQAMASVVRVRELMALQPTVAYVALPKGAPSDGASLSIGPALEFSNVSFAYAAGTSWIEDEDGKQSVDGDAVRRMVLDDVSFVLPEGEILGLLGRTGSGKTTITRLLFRLYEPSSGSILLDGNELKKLPLSVVRKQVGMVTQEVQLFQATLRENITLFNQSIQDERILEVLRELGLWSWYESQPNGLDTLLQAGGAGLSAGQAQLLALVRVFLKDPKLVILDEASSRLDPVTEQILENAIKKLLEGRTAIVIAHRLATVERADRILILENGRVAEFGERRQLASVPTSRFSQLLQSNLVAELS